MQKLPRGTAASVLKGLQSKQRLLCLRVFVQAFGPQHLVDCTFSQEIDMWITAMPDRLNRTKLLTEEFRDNLRLRFGLLPSLSEKQWKTCEMQD